MISKQELLLFSYKKKDYEFVHENLPRLPKWLSVFKYREQPQNAENWLTTSAGKCEGPWSTVRRF